MGLPSPSVWLALDEGPPTWRCSKRPPFCCEEWIGTKVFSSSYYPVYYLLLVIVHWYWMSMLNEYPSMGAIFLFVSVLFSLLVKRLFSYVMERVCVSYWLKDLCSTMCKQQCWSFDLLKIMSNASSFILFLCRLLIYLFHPDCESISITGHYWSHLCVPFLLLKVLKWKDHFSFMWIVIAHPYMVSETPYKSHSGCAPGWFTLLNQVLLLTGLARFPN